MSRTPGEQLRELAEHHLLRTLRPLSERSARHAVRDGKTLLNFASNDYLGLATHPALEEAFIEGIHRYGAGSGAARLVSGTHRPHAELEETLAAAKQTEAALVFSSGFATAVGALPAIVGPGDTIVLDKLAHASLIDGARLSGATLRIFPHNDVSRLGALLAKLRSSNAHNRILVVTESVFSMDGDLCPLREILDTLELHHALLWLDEAHAFGVLGPQGMGLAAQLGVQSRVTFQMGTFSKAAGLSGGYVAASRPWIDLLLNRARAFVYSTAPPPALAHACTRSLELITSQEGETRRQRLHAHLQATSPRTFSPIQPILLGDSQRALQASRHLEDLGFLVPAIRFPTVPRHTARLRISYSAAHTPDDVNNLRQVLMHLTD